MRDGTGSGGGQRVVAELGQDVAGLAEDLAGLGQGGALAVLAVLHLGIVAVVGSRRAGAPWWKNTAWMRSIQAVCSRRRSW